MRCGLLSRLELVEIFSCGAGGSILIIGTANLVFIDEFTPENRPMPAPQELL